MFLFLILRNYLNKPSQFSQIYHGHKVSRPCTLKCNHCFHLKSADDSHVGITNDRKLKTTKIGWSPMQYIYNGFHDNRLIHVYNTDSLN